MSKYTCDLAEHYGHFYGLAPEQVSPAKLRNLAGSWFPNGSRDFADMLNDAADKLEAELTRLGLPQEGPIDNSDGRAVAREATKSNPKLRAELERGYERGDQRKREN